MTATNHALTGALIGLVVGQPVVAVILAVLSHFVLDAIPHYTDESIKISSDGFKRYLIVEALFCFSLVVVLVLVHPENWPLAAICAFLATSPDFMWMPKYLRARQAKPEPKTHNAIIRFHSRIQWFTKPVGAVVEAVWTVCAIVLLAKLI